MNLKPVRRPLTSRAERRARRSIIGLDGYRRVLARADRKALA
jgi:hypothetical protein